MEWITVNRQDLLRYLDDFDCIEVKTDFGEYLMLSKSEIIHGRDIDLLKHPILPEK